MRNKLLLLMTTLIAGGCDNTTPPASDAGLLDAGLPDATLTTDAMAQNPPTGAFVFPPRPALTERDSLRVRGVAEDDNAVAAVRVNGNLAVSSDGFATWTADVPLDIGPNSLTVEVEDLDGNIASDVDSVTVTRTQVTLQFPSDLVVDPSGQMAYVTDRWLDIVASVDLTTGVHRILSGAGTGTGPSFDDLLAIELDAAANRLLVLDDGLDAMLAVDLTTGARTVVSDALNGPPLLNTPRDLVLDTANGRALVLDGDLYALLAVDLATGARTILSDWSHGSGENMESPTGLFLDSASGRLLIVDDEIDALFEVDLATGDRTILSDNNDNGRRLSGPSKVGLAASGDMAWILDGERLYQVDLATGDRTYLSTGFIDLGDEYYGTGIVYSGPTSMFVDVARNKTWVLDSGYDLIVATDLTTGHSSLPWGSHTVRPGTLVIDDQQRYAYAIDGWLKGTVRIDLETSEQTVIADHQIGTGETPVKPRDAVFNPVTQQPIYVDAVDWDDSDWYSAAVTTDPVTGDRTVVAGSTFAPHVGTGPVLYNIPAVVLNEADQVLITLTTSGWDYCDRRALMTIELGTLVRKLLAGRDDCGFSQGTGPDLVWPSGMVLHPNRTHAYVTDMGSDSLLLVDLANGDRKVISDASTGSGPSFDRPSRLTLDQGGTRAIILDTGRSELIAVDLSTGARTVLVTDTVPEQGAPLWLATGIVSDVVPGVVMVSLERAASGLTSGVMMVDLETGYRATVWR